MATFNELCLSTIQQFRTDVGPGISGWTALAEDDTIRSLLQAAQTTLVVPLEDQLPVRNRVAGQIVEEYGGTYDNETAAEAAIVSGPAGLANVALADTEAHFQALVDEDDAEA